MTDLTNREKSGLRRSIESGALTAIAVFICIGLLLLVANVLYGIWGPLGWITLIGGAGGAIGGVVYWIEEGL